MISNGTPGSPVDGKAAFNNFPYQYGIVERTFSEYKSGLISQTLVSDYRNLPADLQTGALKASYESAIVAGTGGNYSDGTPRYFSCQTCHLRPVVGQGCNKNPPVRSDLPLHDLTGGNYWMPDAIQYLDSQDKLRLGGGLSSTQIAALNDGKTRAMKQLSEAANLSVNGDNLTVVNTAGHKLISGYPEGRRMWLNIKWYDNDAKLLREDGKYGNLTVSIGSTPTNVSTILDPSGTNTKIYEAHYAMTKEWADQLIALGYDPNLALGYDRVTGNVDFTLGELNLSAPGTYHETFHFVLNNKVAKDNRIPPYGTSYDEARIRNALPVPANQYGSSGPGGMYNYWDEFTLNPPEGAVYATIDLLYQPTNWEYIQFLYLANNKLNPFLENEGDYMLEAWLNTGMADPYVMVSTTWGNPPVPPTMDIIADNLTTWSADKRGTLIAQVDTFRPRDTVGIVAHTVDESGAQLSGSQVFLEINNSGGTVETSLQGFSDLNGDAVMTWNIPRNQATGQYFANVTDVLNNGYQYNAIVSETSVTFTIQ